MSIKKQLNLLFIAVAPAEGWPFQHIQWELNGINLVCLSEAVSSTINEYNCNALTVSGSDSVCASLKKGLGRTRLKAAVCFEAAVTAI